MVMCRLKQQQRRRTQAVVLNCDMAALSPERYMRCCTKKKKRSPFYLTCLTHEKVESIDLFPSHAVHSARSPAAPCRGSRYCGHSAYRLQVRRLRFALLSGALPRFRQLLLIQLMNLPRPPAVRVVSCSGRLSAVHALRAAVTPSGQVPRAGHVPRPAHLPTERGCVGQSKVPAHWSRTAHAASPAAHSRLEAATSRARFRGRKKRILSDVGQR